MSSRRWWAKPLTPLYAAVLAVKNGLRAVGLLKTRRLRWPVVSVGSLSAGGAGKTPVVIALAKLLRERGWNVHVLSRGYRRAGNGIEMVGDTRVRQVPVRKERRKNQHTVAKRFGDEPVLISRAAGVPVWVGADRVKAGVRAEALASLNEALAASTAKSAASGLDDISEVDSDREQRSVHILDDGFQHRRLRRTVDVVLITAEDLQDALLPGGNLREPLRALRRADAVVIRQEEWTAVAPRVRELMREGTPMWSVERTLQFPAPLGVFSAGLRPLGFCAIARPEGFSQMLQDAGCGLVEMIVFGDHHSYTAEAIEHIVKVAKSLKATGFVTTEKDAVKISDVMRERLEAVGPVVVIALVTEFLNTAEVMSELEERLG